MAKKTPPGPGRFNPVAKNAQRANHAVPFRDRTHYVRQPKHRGRES